MLSAQPASGAGTDSGRGTYWLAPGLGIAASSENVRLRGPALHWAGQHRPARGLGLFDPGGHRAARAVRRRVAGPHRARHRTVRWRNLDWATAQCRVAAGPATAGRIARREP